MQNKGENIIKGLESQLELSCLKDFYICRYYQAVEGGGGALMNLLAWVTTAADGLPCFHVSI